MILMIIKLYKKIKIFLVLITLFLLVSYVFFQNAWRLQFSNEEIEIYVKELKQSESLPLMFYDLFAINNNSEGTASYIIKNFFSFKLRKSPVGCWVAKMLCLKKKLPFQKLLKMEYSLAIKLEQESTYKEQLNWLLSEIDFLTDRKGIRAASEFYFNKEITELNSAEMAVLVIMIENPIKYNPRMFSKRTKRKTTELLKKYDRFKKSYKD